MRTVAKIVVYPIVALSVLMVAVAVADRVSQRRRYLRAAPAREAVRLAAEAGVIHAHGGEFVPDVDEDFATEQADDCGATDERWELTAALGSLVPFDPPPALVGTAAFSESGKGWARFRELQRQMVQEALTGHAPNTALAEWNAPDEDDEYGSPDFPVQASPVGAGLLQDFVRVVPRRAAPVRAEDVSWLDVRDGVGGGLRRDDKR